MIIIDWGGGVEKRMDERQIYNAVNTSSMILGGLKRKKKLACVALFD